MSTASEVETKGRARVPGEIGIASTALVFISIVATAFIAVSVILRAVELPLLVPIATSLFFQLAALISFRGFRIDNVDFEVYREEPVAT